MKTVRCEICGKEVPEYDEDGCLSLNEAECCGRDVCNDCIRGKYQNICKDHHNEEELNKFMKAVFGKR